MEIKNADVISLALRSDDNMKWTPLDCLKEMVKDVESGKVKIKRLAIHYVEETAEGDEDAGYLQAQMTRDSHVALLHYALHRIERGRYDKED